MNPTPHRIAAVRARLRELGLTHYLVTSADEHLNEYLPARNQRRQWLTGFSGSAGDCVVGLEADETRLFADGRYHVQADAELRDSGIGLMRVGMPGVPNVFSFLAALAQRHGPSFRLGTDSATLAAATADSLRRDLEKGGSPALRDEPGLVDRLWSERPAPAASPLESVAVEDCGESAQAKVDRLRHELRGAGCDTFVCVKLDQIAWLLNLRSFDDVPFNPVFCGFLVVEPTRLVLHLHGGAARLPASRLPLVAGLEITDYTAFEATLAALEDRTISIDPARVTEFAVARIRGRNRIIEQVSPIEWMKAQKNATEIARMRSANLLASVAKTRAILWAERMWAQGVSLTEASFRNEIESEYARLPQYRSLSFNTISATGDHAALPHYGAADESPLLPGHTFVIDSGVQIGAGTTDDTRTLGVGSPSSEHKRIFTLVLKAHIQGAAALFPEGTTGAAIDALVRNPLWAAGLDYSHGTGHGVGALLNVHEGPFQIGDLQRRPSTTLPLRPGMITSIEPGFYRVGFGGIRHENLYLVIEHHKDETGRSWLCFESLTYIPFDLEWIDLALLDSRERRWLEDYHRECLARLSTVLEASEIAALSRYVAVEHA